MHGMVLCYLCVDCSTRHYQKELLLSDSISASLSVFRDMFGEECVDFRNEKNISVNVDGKTIHICLETRVRLKTICKFCAFFFFSF